MPVRPIGGGKGGGGGSLAVPNHMRFTGINLAAALASNQRDFSSTVASGLPQLTTRNTSTSVKSGTNNNVPVWFEPITLELSR